MGYKSLSANLGLNSNADFLIPQFKSLFQLIFCILFRACNHQIVDKKDYTEFYFKAFISESRFHTNPGFNLNPALNNLAQDYEHLPVK